MRRLTSRLGIGYGEVGTCVTGPVKSIILAALLTCLLTLTALGQATRGSLSGSVSDPSGATVVGASVTLKNNATGAESKATTDDQGAFVISSVEPGVYSVTVEAVGFKRAVATNIDVAVAKQSQVTIALELGSVNETVTVTSAVEDIINTSSPTLTNIIDTRQIRDLPLPTRNPLELAALQAGIAVIGTDTRGASVAGLRQTAVNVTQDGINAMDNFVKTSSFFAISAPSLNSTSEFSITVGTTGSESGRGVAQVRLTTTGGGNDLHGSLFYLMRNSALNANNFFNNLNGTRANGSQVSPRPDLHQHFYGFTLGGPVVLPRLGEGGKQLWKGRDKAFWFFSYEGFREKFGVTRNRTVLTPEARTGLFRYIGTNGVLQTVNLLAVGRFNTLNPLTQAQLNAMPLPNNTLRGDGLNTQGASFTVTGADPNDKFVTRGDYQFAKNHKFEVVYNRAKFILFPDTFNGIEAPFPGGIDAGQSSVRSLMTIALHSTFGASATNEVRWGRQWAPVAFLRAAEPTGAFITLAAPTTNFDNQFMSQGRNTIVSQLSDNFSVTKGSHTLRMGADLQQIFADTFNDAGINPVITLGTNPSNPDGILAASFPFSNATIVNRARPIYADLVGNLASATATFNITSASSGFVKGATRSRIFRERDLALYATDQWRARRNLTLNYGIRWDYFGVPTIPNGLAIQVTNVNDIFGISGAGNLFNPTAPAGVPAAKATLDFVSGKTGKGLYKNDWNNFAPTFGFAYSPDFKSGLLSRLFGAEGTSSIRGGYSISYLQDGFTVISNALGTGTTNAGLIQSGSNTTPTGVLTAGGVALPTPVFSIPITDKANFDINPGNGLWGIDPNLRTPYVQQWSLGFERELGHNMALEVRYVGNHAIKVYRANDFNEVNIFENGFLQEFLNAQKNLTINGGASFAPGAPGTFALPNMAKFFTGLAASSGFASSGFISNLLNNNVGTFASTLAFSNTYKANRQAATLVVGGVTVPGLPANFFVANPNAGFIRLLGNNSMSNYHSLQVEFRRRLSKGLQFQADYTFSKSLTDATDAAGNNQSDLVSFRTLRNTHLDYRRSNQDQTHRFIANAIYDLPFGSGRHFFSGAHGIVNQVVGGWSIAPIVSWQGRPPFFVAASRTTFNSFNAGNNPAQLVGITFAEFKKNLGVFRTPAGVFFVNPAILDIVTDPITKKFVSSSLKPGLLGAPAPGAFGNFPLNGLSGPHYFNLDLAVVKRWSVTERLKVELKTTLINALNHPNFVYGTQNFDAINFGQITTTSGNDRIVHFTLNAKF